MGNDETGRVRTDRQTHTHSIGEKMGEKQRGQCGRQVDESDETEWQEDS